MSLLQLLTKIRDILYQRTKQYYPMYYVSAKSYREQKEYLIEESISFIIIGGDLKPIQDKAKKYSNINHNKKGDKKTWKK